MTDIEAIETRRSVRNFSHSHVPQSAFDELLKSWEQSYSPFSGDVALRLMRSNETAVFRPSTYGVIKGASDYFLIGVADDPNSEMECGFRFEQVVIKAWQMSLGTCWLAATFKGSRFDVGAPWEGNQKLRIVCPIGVPANKSLTEKLMRMTFGCDKRRPFHQLFYSEIFGEPLSENSPFAFSLSMLRLAPSSTNSQPWRAIVTGDTIHFFIIKKGNCCFIDGGIGLSHFYLAEKSAELQGDFFKCNSLPAVPDNVIYMISYKRH